MHKANMNNLIFIISVKINRSWFGNKQVTKKPEALAVGLEVCSVALPGKSCVINVHVTLFFLKEAAAMI